MRTEYCGKLNLIHINKIVTLCGWIHNIRHLKKNIFATMRDCSGLIQIIFNINNIDLFLQAKKLRNEFCIQVTGIVQEKYKKTNNIIYNSNIEVLISNLKIINTSKPIPLDNTKNNNNSISLKYRYLELRKLDMFNNLKIRHKVLQFVHYFMNKNHFIYIETPILTKSTPEGARDYLIPSRIHIKKFYALPQSPQLFKQLLMISGVDRYYQIAKCFRDEDLRSDRQPEFTQIDVELAFVNSTQVQKIIENMICALWFKIKNIQFEIFPKITFLESMQLYGTDKPDLRNPLKMIDIKEIVKNVQYLLPFMQDEFYRIVAIRIPKGTILGITEINNYVDIVKKFSDCKLFYINNPETVLENTNKYNPINKIFPIHILKKIIKKTQANIGDVIFIIGHHSKIVNEIFKNISPKIGTELKIISWNSYKPVWITDFPMFHQEVNGNLVSMHHPFSSPKNVTIKELKDNPLKVISQSYDLVINGYELGGGSVRINDVIMQKAVFSILGIEEKEQKNKFGFFIDSLEYGAPIHAGMAIGLDRLIMLLTNNNDIRNVIAFPKTTTASCLMTNAPNKIDTKILKELYIQYLE
ncbi:Aspartate--tRNA ligase [Buchnera aphidicola (Eriosoma lanigerum)]|uniref:aspartate--tRNA ligase n=1 Tax=Buchnera aphidicola TaxID=9 RepID=UPI003463CEF2